MKIFQSEILKKNPFDNLENFNELFLKEMKLLTNYHYHKSKLYKKILSNFKYSKKNNLKIEELPYLTTSIFKYLDIKSIKDNEIYRILKSSGTTSSNRSKIFLDKTNAFNQRIALTKIFENYFGKTRLPMLIVGSKKNDNTSTFDAKSAALRGFSMFGKDHTFVINDNKVDKKILNNFLKKYRSEEILIFGFTYDVFEFLINKYDASIDLSNASILHGGGWKKLENQKVSNTEFKKKIFNKFKIKKIINYYGLIEQTGSIFFECPTCNVFQCSNYSNVIIRNKNLEVESKSKGYIQLMSLLPTSYPGHNLITEDYGEMASCNCGFKGKSFKILGRIEQAEIRGCGNV